jgi:hypothetical protein
VSKKRPAVSNLPHAMAAIFKTPAGRVLHHHLTTVCMTLSAVKPTTTGALALADQRSTDIAEGKRWLAIELLGAANDLEGGPSE